MKDDISKAAAILGSKGGKWRGKMKGWANPAIQAKAQKARRETNNRKDKSNDHR